MKGSAREAQDLTISILRILPIMQRQEVYLQGSSKLKQDADAEEQLELCVLLAGAEGWDDEALGLLKIMAACQGLSEEVKEYWEQPKEETQLIGDKLLELADGFERENERNFWIRQTALIFPDLLSQEDENRAVYSCLQAVWDSLPVKNQRYDTDMFFYYSDWFDQLEHKEPEKDHLDGNGLYQLLEQIGKREKVSQRELYEALNLSEQDYHAGKRAWSKFEENGCRGAFHGERLSREQLLYLVVFLNMDCSTASVIMAMAGYRLGSENTDVWVLRYLRGQQVTRDEVLEKLRVQSAVR